MKETTLATYGPGTQIKNELFKPEVAKRRARARRQRFALVRRGEPRFAEPSWVAGEARFIALHNISAPVRLYVFGLRAKLAFVCKEM